MRSLAIVRMPGNLEPKACGEREVADTSAEASISLGIRREAMYPVAPVTRTRRLSRSTSTGLIRRFTHTGSRALNAEGGGLEPPSPCGRQFSRLLGYQLP